MRSEQFNVRLIAARHRAGLTQDQTGQHASLSGMQVCQYEKGRRKPGIDNLRSLCVALDVSADFLLGLIDDPAPAAKIPVVTTSYRQDVSELEHRLVSTAMSPP